MDYISVAELAGILNRDVSGIREKCKREIIPADQISELWLIKKSFVPVIKQYLDDVEPGRPIKPWKVFRSPYEGTCGLAEYAQGTLIRSGDSLNWYKGLSAWDALKQMYLDSREHIESLAQAEAYMLDDMDELDAPMWAELLRYAKGE